MGNFRPFCALYPRLELTGIEASTSKARPDEHIYASPKSWQIGRSNREKNGDTLMLFPTTLAGPLPKPEWLAEPNTLWAPWKSKGDELLRAKRDATLLAVKLQEDAGVDIVTEAEQARQHFVHGFLENVDGIDFAHKVEMGIRKDRYKAMVPQ